MHLVAFVLRFFEFLIQHGGGSRGGGPLFYRPTTAGATTGTVVADAFIPILTPSDAGGFSYAPVIPGSIILNPNTTYIVTAFGNDNFDASISTSGATFGPGITYLNNCVHFATPDDVPTPGDGFPDTINGTGFWGATFKYTLPEPGTLVLVPAGALLLSMRRRRAQ